MKRVVDVVNFNADASCLSTSAWFRILHGGDRSLMCQWLRLYVERHKKVVLGLTGATIADMASFNPEALQVIRDSLDIFQLVVRPFSHDIALLRTAAGFSANVELGLRAIRKEFNEPAPYFLPPEFMLTNEQVASLGAFGIRGTFINPARFSPDIQRRIPRRPYMVLGVFGRMLECIPFDGFCTSNFLTAIHLYDGTAWNDRIRNADEDVVFSWRDGESSFLVPDPVAREAHWLATEENGINREHLGEWTECCANNALENSCYQSYPVHSFLPWMREFRMLSFVNRLMRLEESLPEYVADDRVFAWVMASGSDILSAIEKKPPTVQLKSSAADEGTLPFTILRSERGFEGEEFLLLAEDCFRRGKIRRDLLAPDGCLHHLRYLARMKYLEDL